MVIVDSDAIVHNRHAAASKLESGDGGGRPMENSSTGGASFLLASYPPRSQFNFVPTMLASSPVAGLRRPDSVVFSSFFFFF